ncbi:MAG TPA: DNA repair protein RecN [Polyangia bacterium]|jgi:DNA repair protein RecN|nr:DNA repair protein RecN [Polyangia bacterium]
MLNLLRVSGFALIDEVEVPLGPGLTVITGETGAGKSILVEALGLLRGGRASAEMIRAGCDEARVEAVFELPAGWEVRERLLAEGRAVEDGLVVRRAVARSGRGRIHLGGSLASATDLAASVGKLVDITSQHDQHLLTDADSQLAILDAFAGNGAALAEVREAYQVLSDARTELAGFDADARARAEREDLLRFQLSELEQAEMQPGEDESLRAERERTKGAEKFLAACTRGEEILYSSDDAVSGRIAGVAREIAALAQLDPALLPVVETLRSAQAQVEDSAGELGRYASGIRFDPERLTEIEERLFLIGRLIRKHGGSVAAAIERREAISRDLAALGSFEEGLAARKAAVGAAMKRMTALCEQISEQRRKAARVLGRRMDETLRDLGLAGARVPIAVEDRGEPGPRGKDRVRFLFAPNRGEEPRPLDRIASGGELSRVMLAVKQALAKEDEALTYVFDEVDSGVGGGTAEVIGRMLKSTAVHRQVLVVTHLPQIAAFADHHIRVTKETGKGRTTIRVAVLTGAERGVEIARMLGGSSPSPEAAAHADEMLRRAKTTSAA